MYDYDGITKLDGIGGGIIAMFMVVIYAAIIGRVIFAILKRLNPAEEMVAEIWAIIFGLILGFVLTWHTMMYLETLPMFQF